MSCKRTVQFTLKKTEDKEIMQAYCDKKGFKSPSDLARKATYQYMSKYPYKSEATINNTLTKEVIKAVQPELLKAIQEAIQNV